jgi:hypothetical protein
MPPSNSFPKSAKESMQAAAVQISSPNTGSSEGSTGKLLTKEIMAYFGESRGDQKKELQFKKRMYDAEVAGQLDGMHMMTLLFQSARSRRKVKNIMPVELVLKSLSSWGREWSERDISTFVYGVRSLECIDDSDSKLLKLGAKKITESGALLTSRGRLTHLNTVIIVNKSC